MKTNLLRIMSFVLLFFAAHNTFGQWVVYEGNILLENAGWVKDRTTEGKTDGPASVLATVVDDPDITGNKLLKMEDLVGDVRESWKLEWNIADPNTGVTIVFRSKPTEGLVESAATNGFTENKFLYLSPRNGGFHDALAFWYPDEISFAQSGLYTNTTNYDWIIYRLTLKGDAINLYFNEDPTPVITGTTPKTTTNNYMLYGDNTPEPYGNYLDWMVYDLSGAYAPGEGEALPSELTGLPGGNTFSVTFNVTDGTSPLEGAAVEFNQTSQNTNASGEVVFADLSPASGLAYTVTLSGYESASGTVDVTDANVTENVTLAKSTVGFDQLSLKDSKLAVTPNPVSSMAIINYKIEQHAMTSIDIYDITGKHVENLVHKMMGPGEYQVTMDAAYLQKGMYFCRLKSGNSLYHVKIVRD